MPPAPWSATGAQERYKLCFTYGGGDQHHKLPPYPQQRAPLKPSAITPGPISPPQCGKSEPATCLERSGLFTPGFRLLCLGKTWKSGLNCCAELALVLVALPAKGPRLSLATRP